MPAISMIIDSLLKQIPKAKHIIYKQFDKYVARSETLGNTKESVVENVPTSFDIAEVESQLLRNPIVINGEKLLFKANVDDVVLLDNPYNEICPAAAVVTLKQYKILLVVGFQSSSVKINYVNAMYNFVASCERKKIFINYQVEVQKVEQAPLKSYEFQFKSFVVFQNTKLSYLQSPKPYNEQKLVLVSFLDPNSPQFEFNLQKLSKVPTPIYSIICVSTCQTADLFKSMTKRSYFISQLNAVADRQGVALRMLKKAAFTYMLFKVPDQSDIDAELAKVREAEERQFKILNSGTGKRYVMTEDHEEAVVKQIQQTIEPVMLNMGGEIEQLNTYLRQINEQVDLSYYYFGEKDFAFFGIKLRAYFQEAKAEPENANPYQVVAEGLQDQVESENAPVEEPPADQEKAGDYQAVAQVVDVGQDTTVAENDDGDTDDREVLNIDKDKLLVIFFANTKHKEFQQYVNELVKLQELDIQVILVVQNSWEGNMKQLLRKVSNYESLQLVYDSNNVFRIAQEITNNRDRPFILFFFENSRQLISVSFTIQQCYDYEYKRIKQRELEQEVFEREESLRQLGSSQVMLKSKYGIVASELQTSTDEPRQEAAEEDAQEAGDELQVNDLKQE